MEKYLEFVLKRPVYVLITIASITLFMVMGIPKLKYDNSIDVMMPKEDSVYKYSEEIKKIYGNNDKFIIINISDKNIWNNKFLNSVNNLIIDLEEYKDYDEEKENSRIKKLNQIISQEKISYDSLINSFNDDAPFKRTIKRTLNKINPSANLIQVDDLNKLRDQILESNKLKKKTQIDDIISPLTGRDISGKNDILRAVNFIEKDENEKRILPKTSEEFMRFREKLLKNPSFEKALYTKDSKTGKVTDFAIFVKLINIKKHDKIAKEIWDITRSYKNLSITAQGVPIVNKFMNEYMQKDLFNFLPLVMLVVVLVFFLNFRSIRGMALPFITLLCADLWVLGLMGHLGFNITIVGVSLPSLMVAVGSSYSIHILNQYYIDFNLISDLGKKEGLKLSMSHISITVLLAGITTFFGFISLLSNQISGIREWGIFSAIGVLFAVLISTSLLPACFMLLSHKDRQQNNKWEKFFGKETWIDPVINIFIKITIKHYKKVIIVTIILMVVSIAGIFKVKVETAVLTYFKENDYIRKSSILIGKKLGGYMGMSILINSNEDNGIKNPEYLELIDEVREWLASEKNSDLFIGRTDAFPDIIKSMHMAMNNDNISYYKIPKSREMIDEYLEIYTGDDEDFDGRPDDFESYIDPDYKTALLFAKMRSSENHILNTSDFLHTQVRTEEYLKQKVPKKYSHKITGILATFVRLSDYVVTGQLMSLLFCLIAVGTIVILLFKNIKAGFISLIPLGVAVTFNFGIMGWFGIQLDPVTALIASITIGIGVDDTIHLLNNYRYFRSKKMSIDETLTKTLSISGKAITYTSLALIFGFSVLSISNFKPVILFGTLVAITMIATTLGALLVLPSVIKATGVSLEKSQSDSKIWKYLDISKFFNIKS